MPEAGNVLNEYRANKIPSVALIPVPDNSTQTVPLIVLINSVFASLY